MSANRSKQSRGVRTDTSGGLKRHERARSRSSMFSGRPASNKPDLTASIRKGTQSAMIVDEAAIPDKFVEVVTTRKIDWP